ncbi:hypothetical protein NA56DRAFT_722913 [Hyaloscypha hepaticicola]|uniref:Uncharacterized protein n=1 Tax=Hyaloscypha hepaticicola TaxID=2082293 RepID=A0A2J6Q216_9HELO|nr:hypothetical protein NA56DRAFT_722913 [Hyaloscypha hepaticicola]
MTAKVTANVIANTIAKVIVKVTAIAAKAKATRARNKAIAARIDRILQSLPLSTAGPISPSGPSETDYLDSLYPEKRKDPLNWKIEYGNRTNPNSGKDLSTDSNSSDSQSDSYTRLLKSELIRNLKKKAQRKLIRLKAKKERTRLRARITIIS